MVFLFFRCNEIATIKVLLAQISWLSLIIITKTTTTAATTIIIIKYIPGCLHMQGMHSGFQQAFNALFSAHCIGYPLIVISFNAKYYYK